MTAHVTPSPSASTEGEQATELEQNESSNVADVHSVFAVADYLQLAGMARRSVTLIIYDGDRRLGRIDVQDGTPRDAEDRLGSGEPAFRRLALLERTNISCQPLESAVTSPSLSGSLEYLLMAAARDADELARKKPSLPPRPVGRSSVDSVVRAVPGLPRRQSPTPLRPEFERRSSAPVPHPIRPDDVNRSRPNPPALEQIMNRDSSLRGAVYVAEQGALLEAHGDVDAESTGAVAVLALREMAEIASDLGLGRPRAFQATRGALSLYVVRGPNRLLASVGKANRNAVSVLKLLGGLPL